MEFIEKEEEEVRRRSSVNEDAFRLASQHRRFSQMGRGSIADTKDTSIDGGNGDHKEEV